MAKTLCLNCSGHGFSPGQENKILHATQHVQKKRENNGIYPFNFTGMEPS